MQLCGLLAGPASAESSGIRTDNSAGGSPFVNTLAIQRQIAEYNKSRKVGYFQRLQFSSQLESNYSREESQAHIQNANRYVQLIREETRRTGQPYLDLINRYRSAVENSQIEKAYSAKMAQWAKEYGAQADLIAQELIVTA